MQSATLGSLLLVNSLLLPHSADGSTKSDADVQRHSRTSWESVAYAYTADESQSC